MSESFVFLYKVITKSYGTTYQQIISSGFLFSKKGNFILLNFRGAGKAEIKPYEPDADNAAEGKSRNILSHSPFLKFY